MQELVWMESHLPGGSLEGGLERVNSLYWNISVEPYEDAWRVLSGDKVIFWADSREAVDAFLYGMALAYGLIPDDIFERLRRDIKELVE